MRALRCVLVFAAMLATGCTHGLLSGVPEPSQDRPVARIETRTGAEYGVCTDAGILFLGRQATTGPCRVHYWLGSTPLVEDGEILPWGGVFFLADIDLKHQRAPFLERELRDDEAMVAMTWTGGDVETIDVERVRNDDVEGNVIAWPGRDLPPGTGIFVEVDKGYRLVGLVAGRLEVGGARYLVHTGIGEIRQALLTPRPIRQPTRVRHRPDDITVEK